MGIPARSRRGRRRAPSAPTLRTIASALAAVLLGGLLAATPATPAMAQFPTNEAVVYLAQGDGGTPVRTQLMRGLQSNGEISFSDIGAAHNGPQYNAIGFNEADGFLYGVRSSVAAGQSPKIVRIGPAGGVSIVKDAVAGSVSGAFGGTPNRFYYFAGTNMYYTNVTAPAGTTVTVPLTGDLSAAVPLDVTWANGYFWGYTGGGSITRIGPGGAVTRFTVPALASHSAAGGAFTYGNGNLGFSKNSGGILQVRVTNPGSATPVFTLVSSIAGPASGSNDAASSIGDPADLAITKTATVDQVTRGQAFTYTLTVRNNGGGVSSGFTVTDVVPSHLQVGSVPAGCSVSGQEVTCSGGRLTVNSTSTFQIPVTVRATAPRGTLSNTATVLGNESDPVSANNADTADVRILVPTLSVVKTAAVVGGGAAVEGSEITYTFVVTNTGDLPLTGVQITDPVVSGITPTTASIPVGGTATFTSEPLSVTTAHVAAGSIPNTATATGTGGGQTVSATSSVTVPVPSNPALAAVKSAVLSDTNGNSVADEGETIEYTIAVRNTGNVTLTDVGVDDPMLPGLTGTVTLAPGATHDFVGAYTVTSIDLTNGSVVNSAVASGTPPRGPSIQTPPTTTTTPTVNVGLSLVKSAEWAGSAANTPAGVGDTITYHFFATNTGNVTMEGVTIADAMLDGRATIAPASATIAPGAQAHFTATITVQSDDIIGGEVPNQATASGTPAGGGSAVTTPPASTTVPLQSPTPDLDVAKSAELADTNGSGFADVGEIISYRIVVTNTGNVTLTDVDVFDAMLSSDPLDPVATFASLRPGEQGVFTANYAVTQADIDSGDIPNTALALAPNPTGGPPLEPEITVTVPGAPHAPGISLVKSSTLADTNGNGVADEGEEIEYVFTVRNTGNVTLGTITIDDPMIPGVTIAGPIAPNATAAVSRTYTVQAADLAAGSIVNTAIARSTSPGGTPVDSPPSSTTTETAAPALELVKTASLFDADGSGAASFGETITYSFTVTNTGNTRLEDVRVIDARIPGIQPTTLVLEAGAEYVFTASYTVTEADILDGEIENIARAEGTVPGATTPTASPDSSVTTLTDAVVESLVITKSATLADANGNTLADIGEQVTYGFVVENTGNVTITGITIDDPQVTGLPAPFDLAPGERRTVTSDPVAVTQIDIDAGAVVNVATANGTGPNGPVPSDPSTVTVLTTPAAPALTLSKTVEITGPVNANDVADETEVLTYTFVVRNTGNVTLDDVEIIDPMLSTIIPADSGPLAPGAVRIFTATYTVQAGDVSAPNGDGAIVNSATATAVDPDGASVLSSRAAASVPVAAPGLAIVKTAAFADVNRNAMADVGETVTFSFLVTNTGNVELDGIEVVDARIGATVPVGTLAAGGSRTVTAAYVVTEADIVAQELVNSAKARGTIPGTPPTPIESPESVTSVPLGPDRAALAIVKVAVLEDTDGDELASIGERIVYRFTITNIGNRTITDVRVNDPMIEALLPAPIASLAPGAAVEVEADPHMVAEGDFSDGVIRNIATATGVAPGGPVESEPATATIGAFVPEPTPIEEWLSTTGADIRMALVIALLTLGGGALAMVAANRARRRKA